MISREKWEKVGLMCSLLLCTHLQADTLTWDNGCGVNVSFHCDDNWDTDAEPTTTDDVELLTHGQANPVFVSNATTVNSIDSRVPLNLTELLQVNTASSFENSLFTAGTPGRLRANGLVTLKGANNTATITLEGLAGFSHLGTLSAGSRPVSTSFANQGGGIVTLTSSSSAFWSDFFESGTHQYGERRQTLQLFRPGQFRHRS